MCRQYARVVELADSLDSGSSVHYGRAGSSPASRTKKERHLLKADVFLFWVPPPKGRLHPPVFQMLGGSEFRLRRGFACGKTLARRKCAAGQKAGLTVLLPLPQPLKISILTALYMVGASFVSLAPIFSFKVRSCRCGSFQIATSERGFDLISLDEDHEFHTVAHTMVGATFSLPRPSLYAHAKKAVIRPAFIPSFKIKPAVVGLRSGFFGGNFKSCTDTHTRNPACSHKPGYFFVFFAVRTLLHCLFNLMP